MQREETISCERAVDVIRGLYVGSPIAFEAYSEFERHTRTFANPEALLHHIDSERLGGKSYFDLAVHYPEARGYIHTKRIRLDPAKCGGATWREKTEGWGLVNVQLTYQSTGMVKCRITTNSEKRAVAWHQTLAHLCDPALWDWKLVEKQTRRLIGILRHDA